MRNDRNSLWQLVFNELKEVFGGVHVDLKDKSVLEIAGTVAVLIALALFLVWTAFKEWIDFFHELFSNFGPVQALFLGALLIGSLIILAFTVLIKKIFGDMPAAVFMSAGYFILTFLLVVVAPLAFLYYILANWGT